MLPSAGSEVENVGIAWLDNLELPTERRAALMARTLEARATCSTNRWSAALASLRGRTTGSWSVDAQGTVVLDSESTLNPEEKGALQALMPWRKGPFALAGEMIDAEWRSEQKWQRLLPMLPELQGARICDVGANNGYYLYRAAEHDPRFLLGIDPTGLYLAQWQALQSFGPIDRAWMEPLGCDDMPLFGPSFDLILLMGVLYHHTDPIGVLRRQRSALAKGGTLLVETIVVDGPEGWVLSPSSRYTGARGFYFLPTLDVLLTWLRRAGFQKMEWDTPVWTTSSEQRASAWREGNSLPEGLDPQDPTRTVEGYPAPKRVIVRAQL